MKQIKTLSETLIDWEEEMSKTITVEMTMGELINLTMCLATGTLDRTVYEAKNTFDASPNFYDAIPFCPDLYRECKNIILNNLPIKSLIWTKEKSQWYC